MKRLWLVVPFAVMGCSLALGSLGDGVVGFDSLDATIDVSFDGPETGAPSAFDAGVDASCEGGTCCITKVVGSRLTACLLETDGTVWCWGNNEYASLGRGADGLKHSSPTKVENIPAMKDIAMSSVVVCATALDDKIWCWGRAQLGNFGNSVAGPVIPVLTPLRGSPSLGFSHTCVIDAGDVVCTGDNSEGQVDPNREAGAVYAAVPAPIRPLDEIALGNNHSCGRTPGGDMWCWGGNENGELASPPFDSGVGAPSKSLSDVQRIKVAYDRSCAERAGGGISCWGDNGYHCLNGMSDSLPGSVGSPVDVPFPAGHTLHDIQLGLHTNIALDENDEVWCWGYSAYDTCGANGAKATVSPMVHIDELKHVRQLAMSYQTVYALTDDALWAWGRDDFGQIGSGSSTQFSNPAPQRVAISCP